MKSFEFKFDPLEFRANSKIKFQGFAQGIPYGSGNITLGNYTFIAGVDFDVSQSDSIAVTTLRDAIVNQTLEFWADADPDNGFVYIYNKALGSSGNGIPLSSTMNDQAVLLYYGALLYGKDEFYTKPMNLSDLESLERLEFVLNLGLINGGDTSSKVFIMLQQSIGKSEIWYENAQKQFLPVGFDPMNFNLQNHHQFLSLGKGDFLGNKFRFKIKQTGKNVNSTFFISGLAQ